MSEAAPERPRQAKGKLGIFSEKIGPLPMWAWLAIAAVGVLVWAWYENSKSSSSSSESEEEGDESEAADQVPEFVNQTYTTVTPPAQGAPPSNDQQKRPTRKTTGEGKVAVPGLIGQTQEAAFSELQGLGLKASSTSKGAPGRTLSVISQDPKPGTQVDKGSTVTLTSRLNAPNWPPGKKTGTAGGKAAPKSSAPKTTSVKKTSKKGKLPPSKVG